MNLLLLSESDRLPDGLFSVTDHRAVHVATVLKANVGETLSIGMLNGLVGEAEIVHCAAPLVVLKALHLHEPQSAGPEIDLVIALPRPQTVKKLLIIAGMMRLRQISFIRANRVEKSYYQSPLLEPEAMAPYLIEGLSQGKHTRMPKVDIHERFRPFVEDVLSQRLTEATESGSCHTILPTPEAPKTVSSLNLPATGTVIAAIGPEGGWVPFEIDELMIRGFKPVTLSRSVLRVEHAAMALLAQLEMATLNRSQP